MCYVDGDIRRVDLVDLGNSTSARLRAEVRRKKGFRFGEMTMKVAHIAHVEDNRLGGLPAGCVGGMGFLHAVQFKLAGESGQSAVNKERESDTPVEAAPSADQYSRN